MARPLRIAIADDEQDVREFLSKLLPRLGHTVVVVASNGQELVDASILEHPDLVITDIRMPGLDGDQAVREICRIRKTPYILVSAYHLDDHAQRELDGIPGAYLNKPVSSADLRSAIASVMKQNGEAANSGE